MRVLHVLDHSLPIQSGYAYRTMKLIEGQQTLGFQTYHVTGAKHPSGDQIEESYQGKPFLRTKSLPKWLDLPLFRQVFAIRALRKTVRKAIETFQPDVLHVHSPVLNGLAVIPLAKKYNLPFVYEIRAFWEDAAVDHGTHKPHSLRYLLSRRLETYVLGQAQHITTICHGLKQDLQSRGIAEDKITVVANAVDGQKFIQQKVDVELKHALIQKYHLRDHYTVGFIGSLYAYEGLDLLIEACEKVRLAIPKFKVIIVGNGPEKTKLQSLIESLNLQDTVIILDAVEHEQVPTYYDLFDLCVYPRKRMRLTELVTPLKPLEAMARGIPVLASDVGGHKELIQNTQTGFLFEADNIGSLVAQLIHCKQNNPMEIIFRAKNYVLEQRNWQVTTQAYKDVFKLSA